ncbi:MAG: ketol-acid reductoisomerase [Patescibacteria group bacterium]
MSSANTFESTLFKACLRTLELPGSVEETVAGDPERNWDAIAQAFDGISTIVVVGYSSQGPAHAQNLRDTFAAKGIHIQVKVALRADSPTRERARDDGFTEANGTLVTPEDGLAAADVAIMLISDQAMALEGERYLGLLPKGAAVGLAHGFYLGYLGATGGKIRTDLTVVGVCPKGMGPSVRKLYEQGSGINASFAVHQTPKGQEDRARDLALGWALGIGAPFTFQTTLESEWRSDIFGERAILLGGVHGIVETLYGWKLSQGVEPERAYMETVESLVRPISQIISKEGLASVYDTLDAAGKGEFEVAYNAAYPVMRDLMAKIYRDVSSGREIVEVVEDGANDDPMLNVSATDMWLVGEQVRAKQAKELEGYDHIDPTTAGVYIAGMVAQVDTLRAQGHEWSEVVNESIIEAVDSLNPFMRKKGIGFMVDNCSITARRGDRKWAPLFRARSDQAIVPILAGREQSGSNSFAGFKGHDVHAALKTLSELRPPVDIAV